jgi:hypothetical protein
MLGDVLTAFGEEALVRLARPAARMQLEQMH